MIGFNIKRIRQRRGYSQDRLSKIADLSLNTIVKIEAGRNSNPTIKTLARIAKSLEVKIDDLVKAVILIFALTCFSSYALAQDTALDLNAPKSKRINISQGIKMVLKDNRLIKIALSDNEIAFQDALLGRSALLLHFNALLTKNFNQYPVQAKLGALTVTSAERQPFTFGFDVYQTLFDFGKSLSNYRASQELLNATKAHTESVKRIAVLEFVVAYFDLLESEKMLNVFEKEVESLGSYLDDIQRLYEQGSAVKNDLLPAKVRLADAKQKLIAARNEKEVRAAILNNILALPLRQDTQVDDLKMEQAQFPLIDKAWKIALVERPELAFMQNQIQASVLRERARSVANFPTIFADGGYSYIQNQYLAHQKNMSVELGAKFNLYDGGASTAELLKERAKKEQLKEQKDKLSEDIKFEVEDSFFGLKNSNEKVAVAKGSLLEAEENVRFYRAKYASGSATTTEVLEAITLETKSQTNYYSADYELKRSYAKFMYSMGIDLALVYEKMEEKNGAAGK